MGERRQGTQAPPSPPPAVLLRTLGGRRKWRRPPRSLSAAPGRSSRLFAPSGDSGSRPAAAPRSAPPGHGRLRRARLLARLQEAAGHAAAEAQTAAEERTGGCRRRRSSALRRGPAGPLRARPPKPLLQPGQRAAGGRHPPAAGAGPAAAATGGRVPLRSALLAGRAQLRPRDGRGFLSPVRKWGGRGEGRNGKGPAGRAGASAPAAPARSPLPRKGQPPGPGLCT